MSVFCKSNNQITPRVSPISNFFRLLAMSADITPPCLLYLILPSCRLAATFSLLTPQKLEKTCLTFRLRHIQTLSPGQSGPAALKPAQPLSANRLLVRGRSPPHAATATALHLSAASIHPSLLPSLGQGSTIWLSAIGTFSPVGRQFVPQPPPRLPGKRGESARGRVGVGRRRPIRLKPR